MVEDVFRFADELGPVKIIHVYEPSINLKAILVIDNVAAGPALGGVRMAPDVSLEECFRLARAMTMKNAAAGLPHGGGKVVLYGDPKMPREKKQQLLRALSSALRDVEDYIFAPDMGTDEACMAWVRDEIGRVVGLPREIGGIPLDEIGATGWGLSHSADVAARHCNINLSGARIVIQGFGAVGQHAARFLAEKGAVLIGASDSQGAIQNPHGLDVEQLIEWKKSGKNVKEFIGGKAINGDSLIDIECDIWIPAARPDVIHADNVNRLNTRLIVQGANIPITREAETILYNRGIKYVPDFIANAGGVICAAMEYKGASELAVMATIEEKLRRNTEQVLSRARKDNIEPRQAALELAEDRIRRAMSFRRFNLFSTAPGFV